MIVKSLVSPNVVNIFESKKEDVVSSLSELSIPAITKEDLDEMFEYIKDQGKKSLMFIFEGFGSWGGIMAMPFVLDDNQVKLTFTDGSTYKINDGAF